MRNPDTRRTIYCLLLLPVLATLILNSCTTLRSLNIQISNKEPFPLPEKIQSIAVLNYAMHPGFTNHNPDSMEHMFLRNRKLEYIILDSIVADTAIRVVAKLLYESGRYDVVIPLYRNVLRNDTSPSGERLTDTFINRICRDFNTDAVLVLGSFAERLVTSKRSVSEMIFKYSASGAIDVYYAAEWFIYHPGDSGVLKYEIVDLKHWREPYEYLPYVKDALIEGGIESAKKLAGYISPAWTNYYREYYVFHNKGMDAAIPLIKDNKWEEAAVIWSKYSSVASKSIRSKVAFNMALASEMNGNLIQAVDWCRKSLETNHSEASKTYLSALEARQSEAEKNAGKSTLK